MEQKKALLAVSFGTSHHDTLEKTILPLERELAAEFPDRTLRRAFTSDMIRRKLAKRDGLDIPNTDGALKALAEEGFTDVLIQSTHILNGDEYDKMMAQAAPWRARFCRLTAGAPLLTGLEDFRETARALAEELGPVREDRAVVYMGHGTGHYANGAYAQLEYLLHDMGRRDVIIGTVEGYPGFEEVLRRLEERPAVREVLLLPLMLVAGDHAKNDLAGEEEESWQSMLTARGYRTGSVLRGLGELPRIRRIFLEHARRAQEG